MAILIDKQNPRVYNPNARGAVTTMVHMRADNPFEGGVAMVTKPAMAIRGQLAGLGGGFAQKLKDLIPTQPVQNNYVMWKGQRINLAGLGADEAAPATPATSTGIDWASIAEKGAAIGTGVIQNLIAKPAAPAPRIVVQPPAGMSTTTKVIIAVGGLAAVGLIAVIMMKKA
jgi:hypothetical protein